MGVKQSRRPDNLLSNHSLRLLEFVVGRRGTDIDGLRRKRLKLIKTKRPVVERSRQSVGIFHECLLPLSVAPVHGPDLRYRLMALVDDEQEIIREEVEEAERPLSLFPSVEIPAIVLNARAVSKLTNHLKVVSHTRLEQVFLGQVTDVLIELEPLMQVVLDLMDGPLRCLLRSHKEVSRIDGIVRMAAEGHISDSVDFLNGLDFVPCEIHAYDFVIVCKENVDDVSSDPEMPPGELDVVSDIL